METLKLRNTDSLAQISRDLGSKTIGAGIAPAVEMAIAAANLRARERHARLSIYCDTTAYSAGVEVPGSVDAPAPLPSAENVAAPEIPLEAPFTARQLAAYRGQHKFSLESITRMSPTGLSRAFTGMADWLYDTVDEVVADFLTAADATSQTFRAALGAAAAAATSSGGARPMPTVCLINPALRPLAADQRWDSFLTIVGNRFLPINRGWLLPAGSESALIMPSMNEPFISWSSPGAAASWRLVMDLLAGDTPQYRAGAGQTFIMAEV
jgi:hypothetical protein